MKGAPITESPAAATIFAAGATPDHHGHILKTLLAEANKTIHESLNQTRHAHHDLRKDHQKGSWTDDQIQTVVYVTLGFLVVICVTIIG